MTEQNVLFLHALTSMHPGSGTSIGVVDLPIQRERHTEWPLIPGSSLKGVLRDAARDKLASGDDTPAIAAVFGPTTANASEHGGAVSVSDGRLLAFPVRSLKGVFAWVTCSAVLERFARDMELCGCNRIPAWPTPTKDGIVAGDDLQIELEGAKKVVLEDFDFSVEGDSKMNQSRTELAKHLAPMIFGSDGQGPTTTTRFDGHLAVLHDDAFQHFVRTATEVTARIGLDYRTKTVSKGALFYEEYVPPETIFYAVVTARASRNTNARAEDQMDAAAVMKTLKTWLPKVLQIGAGETVGKGLCRVRFYK